MTESRQARLAGECTDATLARRESALPVEQTIEIRLKRQLEDAWSPREYRAYDCWAAEWGQRGSDHPRAGVTPQPAMTERTAQVPCPHHHG
jgi:hypothetical protein